MAVRRALVFRAGQVGLICAAYEVELEPGTELRAGAVRLVRDCTSIATERLEGADGSQTGLCAPCRDLIAASTSVGIVRVQKPRDN
jgi:hypothetical protein